MSTPLATPPPPVQSFEQWTNRCRPTLIEDEMEKA